MCSTSKSLRLELPGEAIEGRHNADEVDGGTFVWNIDPAEPFPLLFAATTTEGVVASGGVPFGVLVGGGAAAVAGLGGFAWLLKSRRPPKTSPGSTTPVAAVAPAEPVFDEVRGVWTVVDPMRGPLWFHEAANEWVPL